MDIDQSAAIVFGGASGLGAATAAALAARGARVVIADLDEEAGAERAEALGGSFVRADVTDDEAVGAAVAAAAALPGGLRIAVNCAGIGLVERTASRRGPHRAASFRKIVAINLVGTFNALSHEAAAMIGNEPGPGGERGVCVNTASIAAYDGQMGQVAYAASKGGVVAMTLPAARDLAGSGVRVCTIAPGTFDTPLLAGLPEEAREALGAGIPFPKRLGEPSEFAALVCHVVENAMLNGETIRLDGALRMPPK